MPKNLERKKALPLACLVLLIVSMTGFVPAASAAPIVPSSNNYPYVYDPDFITRNPDCWQVGYVGSKPRPSQNLPEGYWYPNTAFDSAWFTNTFAIVGAPQGYSDTATLHAYSTYDLLWGGRGWSNAFVHQGSPPYAGGVYEGRFKAGPAAGSAIPVDGIRYPIDTQEPTGKTYLTITAFLTQNDLNCWQSNNGLLVAFLFQYEFQNGSRSLYDAPPFTNSLQVLHADLFIHRDAKFANIPFSMPVGWTYTIGDAYNGDIHLQYVYNSHMNVGQWYTFTIDYGDFINHVKANANGISNDQFGVPLSALILKYVQVSAETIGGNIEAVIDHVSIETVS